MIEIAQELPYAKQFADALVNDATFRLWFIEHTTFDDFASRATLLHEQMLANRGGKYWWRHNYQENCRCCGCSGRETDVFAILEAAVIPRQRFAFHVEVKYPGDGFYKKKKKGTEIGQAEAYPIRAECWVTKTPKNVLPHHKATTVALFSERQKVEFDSHLKHFNTKLTFEEIEVSFPDLFNKRAAYLIEFFKGGFKDGKRVDTVELFTSLEDAVNAARVATLDFGADRARIIDVDGLPIWNSRDESAAHVPRFPA